MKIVTVSDAWHPQINGVVRTIEATNAILNTMGHQTEVIGPAAFWNVPMPGYTEIRLAILARRKLWWMLGRMLDESRMDALHIATEGPLGWAARAWAIKHGQFFTTAYHTRFPEYLAARLPVPLRWSYALLRRFHAPARYLLTPTSSIEAELSARGFTHLRRWPRGVDTERFVPASQRTEFDDLPRPYLLFVGRVAVEKNIGAFLEIVHPGTKIVVGDGPQRPELEKAYPDAVFVGAKTGDALVGYFANADCFVFPSRTDTFGLVLLEALACGTPVAAYPAAGPLDVIGDAPVGCLSEDLTHAVSVALGADRVACRDHALKFSWQVATEMFLQAHLKSV